MARITWILLSVVVLAYVSLISIDCLVTKLHIQSYCKCSSRPSILLLSRALSSNKNVFSYGKISNCSQPFANGLIRQRQHQHQPQHQHQHQHQHQLQQRNQMEWKKKFTSKNRYFDEIKKIANKKNGFCRNGFY